MTERLSFLPSGEPFATGTARFLDHHPGVREPLARIYVKFIPEGSDYPFVALVDSGGHYFILNHEVAREIDAHLTDKVADATLLTALGHVHGELHPHRIKLVAETGESLEFEATLFVSPDWNRPSVLGYAGALDRICFAVHPGVNRFYFGPLG